MMIGTDIRLMTPLMKELLLNEESIAINQDWLAPPGDAVKGCSGTTPAPAPPPSPAPRPASCSVSLKHQDSHHTCTLGASYGCSANDTAVMWVGDGCRGEQTNGRPAQLTTVLRPADQNCPAPTASDRGVQLQRRHHAVRRPQGAQGPALRVRGCPGASPPHPGRRERPSRRLLAASVAPPPSWQHTRRPCPRHHAHHFFKQNCSANGRSQINHSGGGGGRFGCATSRTETSPWRCPTWAAPVPPFRSAWIRSGGSTDRQRKCATCGRRKICRRSRAANSRRPSTRMTRSCCASRQLRLASDDAAVADPPCLP
jgi:hypothetical protein